MFYRGRKTSKNIDKKSEIKIEDKVILD